MSYSTLEEKLQAVPERFFSQVSSFLDIILSLSNNSVEESNTLALGHSIPGLLKGKFKYPDDINLYDEEIANTFFRKRLR